jgi:hypothetical protein
MDAYGSDSILYDEDGFWIDAKARGMIHMQELCASSPSAVEIVDGTA